MKIDLSKDIYTLTTLVFMCFVFVVLRILVIMIFLKYFVNCHSF